MAKLYGNIASSALMTFDKSFARANGQPLDSTEVYYSLAAAKTYAAGAGAYVGQKIVVIENNVVTHYSIEDTAGTLKELGSKPVGDGQSVSVAEDGTVSIFGFDALTSAEVGYIPQIKEVVVPADPENGVEESRHLEIEWVAISAVVEGDGNSVTTVSAKDKSVTVTNTAEEGYEGYKYEVNVNVSAEAGNKVELKDDGLFVAETDLSDYYNKEHVDGIDSRVADIEKDYLKVADKYDDTAIAGRVSALETTVGKAAEGENEATGLVKAVADAEANAKAYTDDEINGITVEIAQKDGVEHIVVKNKAGEEIASANASKFVQDSFLDDVAYDAESGKITFTWTMGDGSTKTDEVAVANFVQTYTAGNGLTLTGNEFTVDTTVIATVEELNKVKETAEAAQTAQEVSDAIDAKFTTANLGQYAVKTEVETELGKKLDTETYNTDKDTFALEESVASRLADKADASALNDYYTSAQIDEKGFAVDSEVAKTYATKEELKDYAKTADVEADLADKADKTDLNNYYTKEESYAKGEVYTKGETDNKIDAKIASVTGGESAADVKSALESYRDAINAEIWGADAAGWTTTVDEDGKTKVVYTPQYGEVSRIDTLEGEVTNIKTKNENQDKSISDNAAAIKTHGESIATIQGRLDSEDTGITVLNTRLSALETEVGVVTNSRIDGLEGNVNTLSTTVGEHTTALTNLGKEDARLAGLIKGNTDNFANYSTTEQMNSAIAAAIIGADLGTYAKVTDVEAIYKAGSEGGDATGVLADEIARAKAAEKANADAITALVGADTDKTIRAIAAEETAAIVAGADAKYDTLKEIADFLMNDESGAAAMANDIAALKTTVGNDEGGLVKAVADNTAAIAAIIQPKASTEISVANDGTLGINEMNVNKLVQTAGDTLVLNGGSAN